MSFTLEIVVSGLALLCSSPADANCSEEPGTRRILLVDAGPPPCTGPSGPSCVPARVQFCGRQLLPDHRPALSFDPAAATIHGAGRHELTFLGDSSASLTLGPPLTCLRLETGAIDPNPPPPTPMSNLQLAALGMAPSRAYADRGAAAEILDLSLLDDRAGDLVPIDQRRSLGLTAAELQFRAGDDQIRSARPTRYRPGHPQVGTKITWGTLHDPQASSPGTQKSFNEQIVLTFPNIEWAHLIDCSEEADKVLMSFHPPAWEHGTPAPRRVVRASLSNHPMTAGGAGNALHHVLWYYRLFDFHGEPCPVDANLPLLAGQDITSRNGTYYCPAGRR